MTTTVDKSDFKHCGTCHIFLHPNATCDVCNSVSYCSVKCEALDVERHRQTCDKLAASEIAPRIQLWIKLNDLMICAVAHEMRLNNRKVFHFNIETGIMELIYEINIEKQGDAMLSKETCFYISYDKMLIGCYIANKPLVTIHNMNPMIKQADYKKLFTAMPGKEKYNYETNSIKSVRSMILSGLNAKGIKFVVAQQVI